ncbi:hypothetical protein [Candidatus Palauibacter sp.]|uniref:hypothetical protein n=1 Tax=Candidatus Palauibacter sp. TaxID=3101350 RepID=UPI003B5A8CF8
MTAGAGAVIPTSSVPLGDQVALDLSVGATGHLGGLLFVDISIRASFLATQWDLAGINERETLVTVPVTVGLEFPL